MPTYSPKPPASYLRRYGRRWIPSTPDAMTRAKLTRAAGPFVLREIDYDAGIRMPPHHHDLPSVTLVLAGRIRESVGSREDHATPLSVVVKPPGVRHADEFGPRGARTLQIAWQVEGSTGAEVFSTGWRWCHLRRGVREFLALAEDARASGCSPETLESRVWDVLAALEDPSGLPRRTQVSRSAMPPDAARPGAGPCRSRGGTGLGSPRRWRPGPAPPRWIARVREELDDRIAEAVQVRALAVSAGVHPGSLARAFRRHYGESITGYRTRERLRRAVAALALGDGSLSVIAQEAGFADHPHFCRAVRETTGRSPSELKRLIRP